MRTFARAAATAALAVTAAVIPMAGTAMAAPAHSSVTAHSIRDYDDRCSDYGQRRHRHNSWERHWNRRADDCRHRWDRRGTHRAHWHNGSHRSHDGYGYGWGWGCSHRF
ncbi:hypothetical protein [Streptomyces sp. NPDC002133]|uniref:hypothetical protein n=1 Tax=Streptomyces sp. NPDC002133 TaxID=3154409 RepID=UPI00331ED7EA